MAAITTFEERVAFDLGMQVLARHRLQTNMETLQARTSELEARIRELETTPPQTVVGHAMTAQVSPRRA